MIRPDLENLLDELGTRTIPHFGRTLHDHMLGVHALLEAWGNEEAVCLAGLFHSIYGTQTFAARAAGVDQRPALRARLGPRAEELAYLFGACDRDHFFTNLESDAGHFVRDVVEGRDVAVDLETLRALLEIDFANDFEQLPWRAPASPRRRARFLARWATAFCFLTPGAQDALAQLTRSADSKDAASPG
ncbi:MAG TPA: hypothetical protein VFE28_15530 [Candidatus Krumholzibacteria bacterium]|nr:hypothetical protein [Candidatus Krumholzibacteria bacterium]